MIQVQNLIKYYGPVLAVDDVSFDLHQGEVLGFLGPNGAGKSTTMRVITGFLPPSSGSVKVQDLDIATHGPAARREIGYLPENAPAYPEMTVQSFLNFIAEAHGLRGTDKHQAIERVIGICHLDRMRYKTIDTLSKGYRRRTCLAQALIADSPNLVLDEPTEGLDPNQKREVRALIRNMAEHKAIILSTHILEEVQSVCDRVIIIDRGKLICDGTPDELRRRSSSAGSVNVRIHAQTPHSLQGTLKELPGVKDVRLLDQDTENATFRVQPASHSGEQDSRLADTIAEKLSEQSIRFDELHTEPGTLEEFFHEVTIAETEKENRI